MNDCKKIYMNAKVYTVDGENWEKIPQEAIAIDKEGKILAVGKNSEIKALTQEDTEVVDLNGATVLPGFIDSHVHAPGTAYSELYDINLFGLTEKEETLSAIKNFIEKHPEMDSYWGTGFNFGMLDADGNSPCAAWLDEVCPDKEISIRSYDMHSRWVNSLFMKNNGIDKNTKLKGIGNIHRDADGNPTGLFTDASELGLPDPSYTPEQILTALERFIKTMNAWGYTSISSVMPLMNMTYDYYNALEKKGLLTLRVNGSGFIKSDAPLKHLEDLKKLKANVETDLLKIRTAKFLIDGVLEGFTAYLSEPYSEEIGKGENYRGKPEWQEDALNEIVKEVADAGFQMHFHSIGDAATHMVLDAFENAQTSAPEKEYRNVITHLELVSEEDILRFGKLNVIAAIQTFWHFKEPDFYEPVKVKAIGAERAEKTYPAKSFIKAGAVITNSGDYPVSSINNPFWGIQAGVTRNVYDEKYFGVEIDSTDDPKYLLGPDERLSIAEMIEAYTINGAYQMFRENEVGSLKAGKYADLIIIDKDPFAIDVCDIHNISILRTCFQGEEVYGG